MKLPENTRDNNKGIALITTLLVVAVLVAVVVEFNRIAIADIDVSRNFGDEKKILFTTISGVNAVKELMKLDGLYGKSDTLLDEWAKSGSYFNSATSILEEGEVTGKIVDENGKIDINSLVNSKGEFNQEQKEIWERLLSQPKFALTEEVIVTIISCVKDWIDEDDEITGLSGAEGQFYLEKKYHCKNKQLDNIEELLLINGISEDIFYGNEYKNGIRSCFTVYGGEAININTAPIPVLMALSDDITEDLAMEMDHFRTDKDNKARLQNPEWYKEVWPFKKELPDKLLTTTSNYFTITLRGTLRESVKEIISVVFRTKVATDIIYWQEM